MSAIRKLIEWGQRQRLIPELVQVADYAEAELEELEGRGVVVPLHQYENACKQREEAFIRARAAEAQLAERDRADEELLDVLADYECEEDDWGGEHFPERCLICTATRWAAVKGGGK